MFRQKVAALALVSVVAAVPALAEVTPQPTRSNGSTPDIGVGFGLGSFDVVTVRWQNFDFGVGFDDKGLTVDYRLPNSLVTNNPDFKWAYLYVGGIWNDDDYDNRLGARAGIGGHVFFNQLEVFGQLNPVFYVSHDTDLDLEGLVGARFWF